MIKVSRNHVNSLGTMLILSAIDVLLCSFTAGVALFLMGESLVANGLSAKRSHALAKDYAFIQSTELNDGSWCVFWSRFIFFHCRANGGERAQTLSIAVPSNCQRRGSGSSWVVECDREIDSEALATITLGQTATVSVRVVAGGSSFVCAGQVIAGTSVRIGGTLSSNAADAGNSTLTCIDPRGKDHK
jgi:hypothetical protein